MMGNVTGFVTQVAFQSADGHVRFVMTTEHDHRHAAPREIACERIARCERLSRMAALGAPVFSQSSASAQVANGPAMPKPAVWTLSASSIAMIA